MHAQPPGSAGDENHLLVDGKGRDCFCHDTPLFKFGKGMPDRRGCSATEKRRRLRNQTNIPSPVLAGSGSAGRFSARTAQAAVRAPRVVIRVTPQHKSAQPAVISNRPSKASRK